MVLIALSSMFPPYCVNTAGMAPPQLISTALYTARSIHLCTRAQSQPVAGVQDMFVREKAKVLKQPKWYKPGPQQLCTNPAKHRQAT